MHKDVEKEKVTILKIERAGDVLADAVSQYIYIFIYVQKKNNINLITRKGFIARTYEAYEYSKNITKKNVFRALAVRFSNHFFFS